MDALSKNSLKLSIWSDFHECYKGVEKKPIELLIIKHMNWHHQLSSIQSTYCQATRSTYIYIFYPTALVVDI